MPNYHYCIRYETILIKVSIDICFLNSALYGVHMHFLRLEIRDNLPTTIYIKASKFYILCFNIYSVSLITTYVSDRYGRIVCAEQFILEGSRGETAMISSP